MPVNHSAAPSSSPLTDLSVEEQFEVFRRGTVEIVPEEALKAKLKKAKETNSPLKIKLGLDPTAPDLHLGNAVVLRKLRACQDAGHEVTVIIGDFTTMIGDPTGRSETRKQLTREEVDANAQTYANQYHKILDPEHTSIRFNSEWLGKLHFYDVIALAAKTTVARLLERDDFSQRFSQGIPIHAHELLYPICQAYDSVVLDSDVEIGGTDQKFNILMGRDLQREHGKADTQVGLFMPLLVGLDGADKMSKSKGNAIGIDEPPLTVFEKLMSISDTMMPQYFELCTTVPMSEIAVLCDGARTHPKEAKKRLGREVITLYYGEQAAREADLEWERRHSDRLLPTDAPEFVVPQSLIENGSCVRLSALLLESGLVPTGGEAKRLIQQGGATVDGKKFTDPSGVVPVQSGTIIGSGRRKFVRLVLSGAETIGRSDTNVSSRGDQDGPARAAAGK